MYIKFENRENGKRFTYFKAERTVNNEKVTRTSKCVFGNLSESIKLGEEDGEIRWTNDYWMATFCGKALEKAATLEDKTRIIVVEMNIRNVYSQNTKKSYPQIMVTDFDVLDASKADESLLLEIPDDEELPFE